MESNERGGSSCPNWRTAKREDIGQASFKNFSRGRNYSNTTRLRNDGTSSDNSTEDYSTVSYEGVWSFAVEDDEIESFIEVLQKLHDEIPSLFVRAPYPELKKKKGLTVISCRTADYRDENAVRNVVKVILNVVDHPFGVNYFYSGTARYFYLKNVLYRLLKRDGVFGSELIEDETFSITDEVRNISLDEIDDDSSTELPSNVTDRECLFYPSESAVNDLPSQAGKWMLYGSGDLTKMDDYWKKLKPLCDRGVLAALKSSTTVGNRGGVVRAYTVDSENMEDVSKAGSAILEETGYKSLLLYKTNEASNKGMYVSEGKQNVSLYLHAGEERFCFRDEYCRWKLWKAE